MMSPEWCPDECGECNELGNCISCNDGLLLQSFECVEDCLDGFFKIGNTCSECPIECSECSSDTVNNLNFA